MKDEKKLVFDIDEKYIDMGSYIMSERAFIYHYKTGKYQQDNFWILQQLAEVRREYKRKPNAYMPS